MASAPRAFRRRRRHRALEAFLGMDGFGAPLEAQARALRAAVLQWTGIPVSIGIAPTKTLAKVDNRFAKKDPERECVLLLEEAAQDAALARMELADLWGVAGRLAARLVALGIATPLDLKRSDARLIRERLGVVTSTWRSNCVACGASISNVKFPTAKASWRRAPSAGR